MAGYRAAWTAIPAAQRWLIGLLAGAVVLANIAQPYATVAPLHHMPIVALLVASPVLLARWPLSTRTVAWVVLFWLLHTLGGRYTYSNVPYDQWAVALTGTSLSDVFGWTRNHYDRLVHFAFGVTAMPLAVEVMRRHGGLSAGAASWIAVTTVLAIGGLYEIFEWLLTLAAEGPTADAYNGQQGDIWDAQKDMALAFLGALCMLPFELRRARKNNGPNDDRRLSVRPHPLSGRDR